ncbi:MAG: LysM peptidoglycan-binding domain-containing protein [Clostridia bacterium]|nr:LysM peptidoglycan-binding domain-containing protein [Clostridia bacterium]
MHTGKRFTAVIIALVVTISLMGTSYAETSSITNIMINNQPLSSKTANVYQNGALLVPAKEYMNSLGGTFSYDSSTMTGILRQGENEIAFRLDNSIARLNGKYIQAPAPLKIVENRFMIPAQFASEKLGAESYMKVSKNILLVFQPVDGKIVYQVMAGDSLWVISQLFGTSINAIKQLNNLTSDSIFIGQKLIIKNCTPFSSILEAKTVKTATLRSGAGFEFTALSYLQAETAINVIGKSGEWYKVVTPKGNGYLYHTTLSVIQDLADNTANSTYFSREIQTDTSKNFVTYSQYSVQKGDNLWSIAEKVGVPVNELAAANNMTSSSVIYLGQELMIPVYNIAVKSTPEPQYGEILDWFKEAQYLFSVGKTGKFIDVETGKSFMARRTMGASHSDTETVSALDTDIMKEIFGGSWNWNRRSFILEIEGRKFAVSVAGMPHAGVDGVPYLQNVSGRSDNWGYGPNYDRISGNGMNGHFDVYFLNGLRHKDNNLDPVHQLKVLIAGGLQ